MNKLITYEMHTFILLIRDEMDGEDILWFIEQDCIVFTLVFLSDIHDRLSA